ncbi:MAG: 3-hydroxybutyryl-CoA dehydratase [Halioglobus sp.]|nr:3-hydroxybutyryl-CoA dehydratase [Halioglobus sp.]
MPTISNFTFDEITVGQTATYSKTIGEEDIVQFAVVSGDANPVHLDAEFAATTQFGQRVAHGMLTGAIISAALAMKLPGPGSIYLNQSLRFTAPVTIGDVVTVKLEVTDKNDRRGFVTLSTEAVNQDDKRVATGEAQLIAPTEKLVLEQPELPTVTLAP